MIDDRLPPRPLSFAEQDQVVAEMDWDAIEPLHQALEARMPGWGRQTTGLTVYGYMRLHGCTSAEAAAALLADLP